MPIRSANDDIKGTLSQSGLSTSQRTTCLSVGTTATALPATPLTNRNTILIDNLDTTATLYIGESSVTADRSIGTTAGWEVRPLSFVSIDIKDSVVLYGRVASGSILVKVWEVA